MEHDDRKLDRRSVSIFFVCVGQFSSLSGGTHVSACRSDFRLPLNDTVFGSLAQFSPFLCTGFRVSLRPFSELDFEDFRSWTEELQSWILAATLTPALVGSGRKSHGLEAGPTPQTDPDTSPKSTRRVPRTGGDSSRDGGCVAHPRALKVASVSKRERHARTRDTDMGDDGRKSVPDCDRGNAKVR